MRVCSPATRVACRCLDRCRRCQRPTGQPSPPLNLSLRPPFLLHWVPPCASLALLGALDSRRFTPRPTSQPSRLFLSSTPPESRRKSRAANEPRKDRLPGAAFQAWVAGRGKVDGAQAVDVERRQGAACERVRRRHNGGRRSGARRRRLGRRNRSDGETLYNDGGCQESRKGREVVEKECCGGR